MQYKKFSDLTVADYQQLYEISKSEDNDTEKSIRFVAVLTGMPRWDVEEIPVHEFNKICGEMAIIFSGQSPDTKPVTTVVIKGKKYLVEHNPRNITTGQYIDLQHFMKGNIIENLHKIFACLLRRKRLMRTGKYNGTEHEIIAEGVRDLNFIHIHATCLFFSKFWHLSMIAIRDSLEKKAKMMKTPLPQELLDLWKLTDGYITQNG